MSGNPFVAGREEHLPDPGGEHRVAKLLKINAALMSRVERAMDHQANAYSLFQAAIGLEDQVRARTEELKVALSRLEGVNGELVAARDAAERANRFKTRFFTAVGHDLLQPLHAARLTLSAVEGHETPFEQTRLAEQIDHALSTIEELLKTILDLSRLEAGVMRASLQPIPLSHLFYSLALDMEPLARNRGLRLRCRGAAAAVMSDPLMLRRILQNLLANAVQYTEAGGILLAARRRGGAIRIEVWDTGSGIAPAERDRIFEEFQRGSASERTRRGGMGLGLSIVQRMAAALGHPIELHSRLGRGTRFSITVPRTETSPPAETAPRIAAAGQAYSFDGARIVVIENDEAGLEATRTLLNRWGCETRGLRDLGELDSLMRREPDFRPALVLADYHLDRRECGLAGVLRLREAWGQALPAIVVTADHSPQTAEDSRRAGCEVLCKPVKPAELRALMGHLVGRGAAIP